MIPPKFANDTQIKGAISERFTVLRSVAGVCGIASQVIALISLLAAVSGSPWFSWTEGDLSILGVEGSAATLFNSGLILAGVFNLIFAIGLRKSLLSGSLPGQLGVVSLIVGSVAFSAMGIFRRTIVIPHNLASLAFFIFISLAIFLIGIWAITAGQKIWGALSVTAAILVVVFLRAPWPWSGGAIPQLLSCLPWSLWTVAFAVRLLMKPEG